MTAEHGTRSRYVHGPCRCEACCAANTAYRATHDRLKLYARYDDLVDAAPVREHVMALSGAGIGRRRLVALSGVADTTIESIKHGKRGKPLQRVRKSTAERILAVTAESAVPAAHALVDARGTHRRLQALIARGWAQRWLCEQLGLTSNNMAVWFNQSLVLQRKAEAVAALYEDLWDQQPPIDSPTKAAVARRSMNYARERGWMPPLGWDDIDTDPEPPHDDEQVDVDEMAIELAMLGEPVRLSGAELRIAVEHLHGRRWSDARIAEARPCRRQNRAPSPAGTRLRSVRPERPQRQRCRVITMTDLPAGVVVSLGIEAAA